MIVVANELKLGNNAFKYGTNPKIMGLGCMQFTLLISQCHIVVGLIQKGPISLSPN